MFATRTMRMEWELVKWMAILALAGALAMFWAIQTAGAVMPVEPGRLPTDMPDLRPMPTVLVDPNVKLWAIIDLQRAGYADEALAQWETMDLPCETEVWRQIAMGVANLQLGQTDEAAEHLMLAEDFEPHNPLVHYYLGLLRLDQAKTANEWYDAIGEQTIRWAAYRPRTVAPNTRGMYELAAMQEFETAIANARRIDRALVLAMPDYRVPYTLAPVTVGDLMVALGCEHFEGQAHNVLGAMHLDRGATDNAEYHMDAATDAGLTVVFGYRDLGAAYEQQGRHADAARAYLKAIENEPGMVTPLRKILRNLGRDLLDL